MLRRWFTLFLISLLPMMASAQSGTVYPIELSVMMTPPYGTCLKEYVGSNRITVQAMLKDFSKRSDQFVLQLKVTDNRNRTVLMTNFGDYEFKPGEVFTYPLGPNSGQNNNNILNDIFRNATVQPKNECFEEGAYTFTFQAFAKNTYPSRRIALSQAFSLPIFLQGNTVEPLQIYPYENEVICNGPSFTYMKFGIEKESTHTGVINYQWQAANPTGMRVGYRLQVVELGEIGDQTVDQITSAAQSAFGNQQPLLDTRTIYTSIYSHPISEGTYKTGYAYAWRVFALTGKDLEGEPTYDNKRTPVRVFYYCGFPEEKKESYEVKKDERQFDKDLDRVKMDTVEFTGQEALASWLDFSGKDKYCGVSVEIRKNGQEKWTPFFVKNSKTINENGEETSDHSYNFEKLSYDTRYEVRAQYVQCKDCENRIDEECSYAPYSDTLKFMIPSPVDSATCGGDLPKLTECENGSSAPEIMAGDIIMANGTQVVVDSVSYPQKNDSSIISGTGHICFPIIKNIQMKMKFDNIKINCAKELVKGKIVSIYDEKTCAMINIDELTGEGSRGGKDNSASDAQTTPYSPQQIKEAPEGTIFVKEDKTVVIKTKTGEATIGNMVTLSAQEYKSKDRLEDNTHYIEFFNEDPTNAFDNDAQGYYRKMSKYDYFDNPNNTIILPWLANNPGKLKKIRARERKKKETIEDFDSVMFAIPSGSALIQLKATKRADKTYDLEIPGWADVDHSTPIYAIARNKGGSSFFDAGKLMQANYKERTHKLIIVPTREEYSVDVNKIKEQLDAIYGRVGVTYEVVEDRSFVNNETVRLITDSTGLDIGADDESRWQVESGEMKIIRDLYKDSKTDFDKKSAYLFLVNQAEAPYENVEGDMPRNQSVGYIFMNGKNKLEDGRVVAHELGHGVYKFQHTKDYDLPEKSTDNLMDYAGGDFLAHYQWRIMQDSVMFVWKGLQDDEDGMWTTDGHYYLFTLVGMLMGVPYDEAEMYGRMAERPDTYVLSQEDINKGSVMMGDSVEVNLKTFGAGYIFEKGDIRNQPQRLSTYLHDYTVYVDKNHHVFKLPNNVRSWGNHVITQKDIDRGYFILGKDQYGVELKVSWDKFNYKAGDMLENITWMIPELQQRNHTLTGGYFGVELAATAYAIKHRKELGFDDDFNTYLLHRFGDVYAHFSIEQEAGFNPEKDLSIYIDMMENFLDKNTDNIKPNIHLNDANQRVRIKEEGVYRVGDVFVSSYSREETKKIIIRSLLTAKSEIKRYNPLTDDELEAIVDIILSHRDLKEYIKDEIDRVGNKSKWEQMLYLYPTCFFEVSEDALEISKQKQLLKDYFGSNYSSYENSSFFLKHLSTLDPKGEQDDNVMYGDEVTCVSGWTSGHMDDKGKPDDIIRRHDWFMYYVKHVTELYPLITPKADPKKATTAINRIKEVVDWGVKKASGNNSVEDKDKVLGWKLDAIFRLLIELERNNYADEFTFAMPIKSLPEELNNGLAKTYYTIDRLFLSGSFEDQAGNNNNKAILFSDSKFPLYLIKYERKTDKTIEFKFTKVNYRSAKY